MDKRLMQLPDRRELAWAEMVDPAGYPVFAFHGTPGSRQQILVEPASAHAAGARVIAPDRPGCGASTPAAPTHARGVGGPFESAPSR